MTTDFIKLATYNTEIIDYFSKSNILKPFKNIRKYTTNDPKFFTTTTIKEHKGIYFFFYSKELKISFYPHYHFNNYLHNANDFIVNDAINTTNEFIKIFEDDFGIDLYHFRIVNIEFGLNVVSPIDIKYLIGFLSFHGMNEFKTDQDYPFSKKSFSVNKTTQKRNENKMIKAYAKGIQFPDYCNINTLRFEVKSKESAYIRSLGIKTIYDLLNISVYKTLEAKITEEFNNVLLLDYNINTSALSPKEQLKIRMFINPTYWNMIIAENKRNDFRNKVNEYYKIIDKTGNHLKRQLEKIILDKLLLLNKNAISTPKKIEKKYAVSTIIYNRNCTQNKATLCKVTGLNISM